MPANTCSVDQCSRAGKIRLTYCENHYRKFKRYGTPTPPPKVTHGTASKYRYGCRCAPCTAAHSERYAKWARSYFEKTGEWNRGRWISDRDRHSIYERDAWTCKICQHPIDRDAHANSPLAPSLDHVKPKSSTSKPDHTPNNLRTAHRWCNAVRGDERLTDEAIKTQMDLVLGV